MKIIIINGERVEYKSGHRALREYERLFGKRADEVSNYTDTTNLMYAITKVQCQRQGVVFDMTIDEFIDYLDNHPDVLEGFTMKDPAEPESGDTEKKS